MLPPRGLALPPTGNPGSAPGKFHWVREGEQCLPFQLSLCTNSSNQFHYSSLRPIHTAQSEDESKILL